MAKGFLRVIFSPLHSVIMSNSLIPALSADEFLITGGSPKASLTTKAPSFKGSLFYKFATDISRFDECTEDERRKYLGISMLEHKRPGSGG